MKKLRIVALVLLLFSCGQEKKQVAIPSDVLPVEKMAQVLTDVHYSEAEKHYLLPSGLSVPVADSIARLQIDFKKVFEKNKITKEQYDKSISFYLDHLELLNEVYQNVLNEVSKMQSEAGKK
ncbi:MAG TPA: DUF4296 domain-containing protein [Bacteroidia bacterium]